MTSMPRVGLAVLFLFALQGCEDKGTCETAETEDKKEKKEACCKDGKPGEGKPSAECCEKKDAELKACLQAHAKSLGKPAPATPDKTTGSAAAQTTTSKLEVQQGIVLNAVGKSRAGRAQEDAAAPARTHREQQGAEEQKE